jgi:hypothetical protein
VLSSRLTQPLTDATMLTWKSAKRSGRHNALPWGPSDRLQRKGFLVGDLSFPVLSRTTMFNEVWLVADPTLG